MIDDHRALTIGGYTPLSTLVTTHCDSKVVDMFDFETRSWTKLKMSRFALSQRGVVHSDRDQRVFCVGGINFGFPVNKAEYLDLAKNQWIRLPDTKRKHGHWPLVWKQSTHNDVLYVGSMDDRNLSRLTHFVESL